MHIELIDQLRCPAAHPESTLILAAERWDDRSVVEGSLGCPVCRARYPIRAGVADFSGDAGAHRPGAEAGISGPAEALVVRLAAQLDLQQPGSLVVLAGSHAAQAQGLAGLAEARCILVNAIGGEGANRLAIGDRLPLADAVLRGIALDRVHATPALLAEAVRTLVGGGRLVAPAGAPVPTGVDLLARDEHEWVGVAHAAARRLVSLGRRVR